ncbi:hypothetical protein Tco_0296008 [Tanacetum coccineum]
MVANTIDTVTSVLSQRALDLFCATYNIPTDLNTELPGHEDTIKNSPEGKIGIYTRFIMFANFRIPLSKFLLSTLQYYQINFSQLSILGAAKNDNFFWIDASSCPIFVPWYNEASVRKYSFLYDDVVDLDLLDKLDNNRTLIRKYPKTFLYLAGLSRSFDDPVACPTLLNRDKSDMGLLDFVKSVNPFKVNTDKRTLAEGELEDHAGKKKKKVGFSSGSHPMKKEKTDGIVVSEPVLTTAGKSPTVIQRLIDQGKQLDSDSGFAAPRAEEFVSSSVTLTPDHEDHEDSGSTHDGNIQTRHASERYVVGVENVIAEPIDGVAGVSVPGNGVGTSSVPSDETGGLLPNLIDHVPPSSYRAFLRNHNDVDFLDLVNANSAQHICMMSELHLRYEHEITVRERFEKKFTDSSVVIQQRDAEIVDLKSRLGSAESEAAEVIKLCRRVSELEAETTVKAREVVSLNNQNAELFGKSLRDEITGEAKMREEIASLQDAAARRFEERWAEMGHWSRLSSFRDEVRPILRVSFSLEKGYIVGHQQRNSTGFGEFKNVSFSLLEELEALKDSSLALLMSVLTLEGDHSDVDPPPKFLKLQHVSSQVTVTVYFESGGLKGPGSVSGEILLSDAIATLRGHADKRKVGVPYGVVASGSSFVVPSQGNALVAADYQISTLTLTDDAVPVI